MIALRNTENKEIRTTYEWIEAYSGNFEFLLSLKAQLLVNGYLSEKQIAAAEKCRNRETKPALVVPTYSIKVGDVLEVKKSFAQKLARQNGSPRIFFNFEVLEIKAETRMAFLIKTRASAKVTSHCCVCGRTLTDPVSILTGIGPVCADKNGIPYGDVDVTKAALEEIATKEVEIEVWIPKSTIKNLNALTGVETTRAF